jgi:uncharacterized protein Usg
MLLGWDRQRITTLQILYYIPDYRNLLQEFLWQFEDITPDFPRTHKFLLHWKHNIHATIHTVTLAHTDPFGHTRYINAKQQFDI